MIVLFYDYLLLITQLKTLSNPSSNIKSQIALYAHYIKQNNSHIRNNDTKIYKISNLNTP